MKHLTLKLIPALPAASSAWQPWLVRAVLVLGGMAIATGSVGLKGGMHYVNQQLAPKIAKDLSHTLQRPVVLGEVEEVRLTGLHLGPSVIPATDTDADEVRVEGIWVRFSPWDAIDGKFGLTVILEQPQLYLDQNELGEWLETEIQLQSEDDIQVTQVRVRDAKVVLAPFATPTDDHLTLHDVSATIRLDDAAQQTTVRLSGVSPGGGRLRVSGQIAADYATDIWVRVKNVAIAPLSSLLPPEVTLTDGVVNGRVRVQHQPGQAIALGGHARLKNLAAWVEGEPNPFTNTGGQFRFQGQEIVIERGKTQYGLIPFEVQGRIHLHDGLDLTAQVESVTAADFMETFNLSLPFPVTGALHTDNLTVSGPFDHVVFAGTVSEVAPIALDRLRLASARTDFTLDKSTDDLHLFNTEFVPEVGGQIAGTAQIKLGDVDDAVINLEMQDLSADAIAQVYDRPLAFPLGTISGDAQVVVTESSLTTDWYWQLAEGRYPARGTVRTTDEGVYLRDTVVQVGDGAVTLAGVAQNGGWEAVVSASSLPLRQIAPNLAGEAEGRLTLAGTLDDLNPSAIQAEGDVVLTDVVPVLAEPLRASVAWDGDRLHLHEASAPGLSLNGWVAAQFDDGTEPAISAMNLNLGLHDYDLAALPVSLPEAVSPAGRATLEAVLTGTPEQPQLAGTLQIQDLAVNAIAFEPQLKGPFRATPDQGMQLTLTGQHDRVALVLDTQERLRFDLQRDRAQVDGTLVGDRLVATASDVPLTLLSALGMGEMPLGGSLTGRISAHLAAEPAMVADVAIANPTLGRLNPAIAARHQDDRLVGRLRYADGQAHLEQATLRFGDSLLHLSGQANPHTLTGVQGRVQIQQGDLRDVVTALDWLPQQDSSIPLMQAFTDLPLELEGNAKVSDLDVQGQFSGDVHIHTQPETGAIATQFDFSGQQWRWGSVVVEQVRLQNGDFDGTYLTLPRLHLSGVAYQADAASWRSPETNLTLVVNGRNQSGQLQVEAVPLRLMGQMTGLDGIDGNLDAIASWQAGQVSPEILGEVTLQNPRWGRIGTPLMQMGFGYQHEHVRLGQWTRSGAFEELIAIGRIPLQIPLAPEHASTALVQAKTLPPPPSAEALPPPSSSDLGAEQLIVALGLLQPSFSVTDLHAFAETGQVPNGWGIYLSLANLDAATLQTALTQTVPVDLYTVDHVLNSPFGEQILAYVGQVIHTPSRRANVQALRSALVRSALDDRKLSILEVIDNYPHREIYVDLDRLITLLNQLNAEPLPSNHQGYEHSN